MAGHLEEAAGALNAAAQAVPVDLTQGTDQQLATVLQYVQQAGGSLAEQISGEIATIQQDLQGVLGRLVDLQGRLQASAQQVMQGGA